ncbi:MAG: hypothetical protein NTY12_04315 [Candidatus Falkowbacteria bacterium]|nr:hypothetical protein [Candidatus Falkowbacteria bacterium]
MAIIALGNARAKARDSKRVADIKQISTALELYYADNNSYPTIITPGNSITSPDGTKTYMASIPNNPSPRNDGNCPDANYGYMYITNTNSYYLYSCTNSTVGSLTAGAVTVKPDSPITNEPLSGLVAWWKLDEGSGTTAYDSSGNGNTGTWATGGTHYIAGRVGAYAGSFNGTSDYINCGISASVMISTGTITAWEKFTLGGTYFYLFNWSPGLPGVEVKHYYDSAIIYLAGANYEYFTTTPVNYLDGNWHHVAFVITGNGVNDIVNSKMYVDGQEETGSGPANGTAPVAKTGCYIGWPGGSVNYIDDLRIYNRALSAAEISALYNATK